jgi:NAD(P)H-dependent flavin oxidoreductase YrpB (nitropropane dioxygenase family)
MISISQFRIIALTPAGIPRPEIAIAAARAGEIGVVDLEYTTDLGSAKASFQTVSRYTNGDFGIKLGESNTEWLNEFLSESPEHFRLMLLSATQVLELKSAVQSIQSHGLRVFIECHTLEQANHAEQMGVDAVIAKGNESGGRVGPETTYILLQKFIGNLSIPVYAQGGIGLHTAAACYAGGAHGVVLDNQMLLTRESPLSQRLKNRLITFDGSETVCIGEELGQTYRVCTRLGLPVVKELQSLERNLSKRAHHRSQVADDWHQAIARRIGWDSAEKNLLLMGQDIAFAASLGKRFVTVSGILQAVRKTVESHIKQACRHQPFSEGSPLAQSHRTRYPIVQGPMARISDNPAFALQVAEKGALPLLAVSWMHGNELDTLLQKTRSLLKDYSWGVGLLGFLPAKLYQEQIKVVQTHHPSFALLGGGRPDQVKRLEQEGIATYAHVPSPALLKMFMENGVCRFVFEGLESGGHIGPRCSFVLWDQLIDILLEETLSEKTLKNLHILFAGGIHDSVSSAMVSAAAAPLVERGIRVGVQLGSAYLLTHEAVKTAALVKDFQQAVLKCNRTVVLESGGGHANRSAETPFAKTFRATRQRLLAEGQPSGKIRQTLDRMTIGKLRIAAKGFDRNPVHANDPSKPNLVSLSRSFRKHLICSVIGKTF